LEAKAQPPNIGEKDDPAEFTARWLFREAWKQKNRGQLCNANTMNEWGRMEAKAQNIGPKDDPAEYTARWIFRQAWKGGHGLRSPNIAWNWAWLEMKQKNGTQDEFGARWVANHCLSPPHDQAILGCLAYEEGSVGNSENPQPDTGRFIFRELFRKGHRNHLVLWASYERAISAKEETYGLQWIFEQWKRSIGKDDSIQTIESWLSQIDITKPI
jgi:hypothetical protein